MYGLAWQFFSFFFFVYTNLPSGSIREIIVLPAGKIKERQEKNWYKQKWFLTYRFFFNSAKNTSLINSIWSCHHSHLECAGQTLCTAAKSENNNNNHDDRNNNHNHNITVQICSQILLLLLLITAMWIIIIIVIFSRNCSSSDNNCSVTFIFLNFVTYNHFFNCQQHQQK